MGNVNKYIIIVGFLVFSPLASANTALNTHLKLDGVSSGSKSEFETSSETKVIGTGDANNTGVYPKFEDKLVDMGDAEPAPPAAGPAILEIDPVEGDPDYTEREGVIQHNESDLDFSRKNTISAEAQEIRGWDEKKKSDFLETVKEYSQVKSGQDLENFAKGVLLKDEKVKSIQADEEKVEMEYKMPARFLGIFSASLAARAKIARDGSVKVAYPWYSFLFKKLVAANDIKSEAEASLPEVGDEALVLFEKRALMIKTLSSIMKTKHDTVKNSIGNIR